MPSANEVGLRQVSRARRNSLPLHSNAKYCGRDPQGGRVYQSNYQKTVRNCKELYRHGKGTTYSPRMNGRDHRRSVRFSGRSRRWPPFLFRHCEDIGRRQLPSFLSPAPARKLLQISTVRGIGVIVDYCEEDSIIAIFCHNKSSGGVLRSGKALLSQLFASLADRSWLRAKVLRNRACLSVVHRLS